MRHRKPRALVPLKFEVVAYIRSQEEVEEKNEDKESSEKRRFTIVKILHKTR